MYNGSNNNILIPPNRPNLQNNKSGSNNLNIKIKIY